MRDFADVDWPLLLNDLVYLGMTGTPLAARLQASPALLRRIEAGEQPRGVYAHRLVALWCDLTAKPGEFVPKCAAGAPVKATPGLASDEEQETPFVLLQAVLTTRGSIPR